MVNSQPEKEVEEEDDNVETGESHAYLGALLWVCVFIPESINNHNN